MSAGELTDEEEIAVWSDLLAVNLTGVFLTAKVAIPHLVAGGRGGSIIQTSSTAALKGFSGHRGDGAGYTAAKHGIVGLVRTMANSLAPQRIRVNSVAPTGVRPPMIMNESVAEWIAEARPGRRSSSTPDHRTRGREQRRGFPGLRRGRLHHRHRAPGQRGFVNKI